MTQIIQKHTFLGNSLIDGIKKHINLIQHKCDYLSIEVNDLRLAILHLLQLSMDQSSHFLKEFIVTRDFVKPKVVAG